MWIADNWKDYELIDASNGERLERWGQHILVRPDPQVIWKTPRTSPVWKRPEGRYSRATPAAARGTRAVSRRAGTSATARSRSM